MKSIRDLGRYGLFLCNMAFILLLASNTGISAGTDAKTTKTLIWDTNSPFGDSVDLQNRTNWKIVPTNLFTLERDPVAAGMAIGRLFGLGGMLVGGVIGALVGSEKETDI